MVESELPGIQLKSIKASDTASCICYVRKLGKIWSSRTIRGHFTSFLPLKSKFTVFRKGWRSHYNQRNNFVSVYCIYYCVFICE